MRRFVFVLALLLALPAAPRAASADEDLLHVVSNVVYDLRPDAGGVRVTWDVDLKNQDPSTRPSSGTFYRNISLPVLAGATSFEARSRDGNPLRVTAPGLGDGLLATATIEFSQPLYFRGTYAFSLSYQLSEVRSASVLVTPNYLFLPVIAAGDEATVTVNTPPDAAWPATIEPGGDCAQEGNTFRCSGGQSSYLAGTAEVSRPDATASTSFAVQLREATLAINVTYFQGEDAFAGHLQALAAAALPLIEEEYGFAYRGTPAVTIAQGGRQAVLGYEGLTSCDATGCHVTVSPAADDVTLIHELAHLWSGIYAKRWLAEGFAQLVAEDVAARLPEIVRGATPRREPAAVPLALDDWGEVGGAMPATQEQRAVENAGYDLSLRFLYQLRYETGAESLRAVNAAIAARGAPVNSRSYLDAFENTTGRSVDHLFGDWVFPASYDGTLTQRREARQRVSALNRRLAEAGLPESITARVQEHIAAWRFGDALAELHSLEDGFATYEGLRADIEAFKGEAASAGLGAPEIAAEQLLAWNFSEARLELERARQALAAYLAARAAVDADRTLLERFGLLGKDPGDTLERAAAAFTGGEFERSRSLSDEAREAVEDAEIVALRRFAIVFGIAGFFAVVVLAAVWLSRNREHEFA